MLLRGLAGLAAATLLAVPAFHSGLTAPANTSATQLRMHKIRLWHMSLTVPVGWKLTSRSVSLGETTWTIEGSFGSATITSLPLSPKSNVWQLLPIQPGNDAAIPTHASPYLARTVASAGHQETVWLLTAHGTADSLTVNLNNPTAHPALMHQILSGWKHPPLMTVTKAVTKMEHLKHWYAIGNYVLSFPTAHSGWLLAAGPPATAQESWYLFHTTTGDRTWQLERYTVWQGCESATEPPICNFLRSAGEAAMLFWNAQDGVIAQATFPVNFALIYRTTDGGKIWSATSLKLPTEPQSASLHQTSHHLYLTLTFYRQPTEIWVSNNGGVSWRLVRTTPAGGATKGLSVRN
ncbi:MAG: hypothetical protein C7B45_15940 [Sulfobacillus acidophilus]|uniref:Photosynthesis system II assembly factor Ycf48/Hcf136-like domain-containing protein n=1 Tax=Sulfobacillus acidophilus TaxID=53633 RepID=A0A2T2WD91_9FIRM|nr:MAG: hypothetical protein C7B45_15940 [Sulfobacillus acidophilus]